jgi:hypothetical protein
MDKIAFLNLVNCVNPVKGAIMSEGELIRAVLIEGAVGGPTFLLLIPEPAA